MQIEENYESLDDEDLELQSNNFLESISNSDYIKNDKTNLTNILSN